MVRRWAEPIHGLYHSHRHQSRHGRTGRAGDFRLRRELE
jgi:hypothetical protein